MEAVAESRRKHGGRHLYRYFGIPSEMSYAGEGSIFSDREELIPDELIVPKTMFHHHTHIGRPSSQLTKDIMFDSQTFPRL